jgi:hypothetical protein
MLTDASTDRGRISFSALISARLTTAGAGAIFFVPFLRAARARWDLNFIF